MSAKVQRPSRVDRRLKLRQLEILSAVVDCGTMGKAAERLAVSQPVVSKAIADLERTLGVQLLERSAQGVEATDYGRALLKWSAAVFDNLRQGIQEIEFLSDPTAGEVKIGCGGAMIEGILPAILLRLRRRHPRLRFEVVQANTGDVLYRALRDRSVDLVIGRVVPDDLDDDLSVDILFDEPFAVVAGRGNPWTRRRHIELAELVDEPWILPRSGAALAAIADTFAACGLRVPRSEVVCSSIHMHSALLADGRFLALRPASVLRFGPKDPAVKVLPVTLPALPRPVGIVTLKGRMISPVAQRFIDYARETASSMRATTPSRSPRAPTPRSPRSPARRAT
jgi:DNA-binding transcriptional LysR family regulator